MVYTRKNDEAVSPVIGVILMVAITVILAAVIAAFVFGMSGNINKTKIVAVTAQQPDLKHITVTYQGGQDHSSFTSGTVTITPDVACTGTKTVTNSTMTAGTLGAGTGLVPLVGSYVTEACSVDAYGGKDHIVATGSFGDGSTQVLLDTYV
jgi:flagellin-like protein